ncbi:putative urea transporter 1-like [Scophthalmus maximus]|uniref:Putative urea transporter 1-like n=1 Tax=Scophthalmus maximus TaxID=52904 RepID=A0A2U9CFS9_SCOMX|nr:putative urea transporter 1-like [Scophthalmus maximus]
MTSARLRLMSVPALPACTWPLCLSTLISILVSSEILAPLNPVSICLHPPTEDKVTLPETNERPQKKLRHSQQSSSQEEALPMESGGPNVRLGEGPGPQRTCVIRGDVLLS